MSSVPNLKFADAGVGGGGKKPDSIDGDYQYDDPKTVRVGVL